MKNIQIIFLPLTLTTIIERVTTQELIDKQRDDFVLQDLEDMSVLKNAVLDLVKNFRGIKDELDHLKELSKVNAVRTCQELLDFGVRKSDYYFVDPDGPMIGEEPIRVYCLMSPKGKKVFNQ